MNKWFRFLPKSFLWRLTIVNVFVISSAILLTGWAVYETACFLVDGIGNFSVIRQQQFNATLFEYLLIFTGIAVCISSVIHFYVTRKLISPINELIEAIKILKKGTYPAPITIQSKDEVGKLVSHYNELLYQLQKNEEQRKKLVDDVSHELRTPIANLTGYLYALKSGDLQGSKQLFAALHEQTERLTNMVEQIERLNEWDDHTKQQHTKKETVQIKEIVDQCIQLFSLKCDQTGLRIDADIEREEVFIHKEGIRQVVTILLDNAIRYYEGNGSISVIGMKQDSAYVISVSGPGAPINREEQSKIFDRFYRIDPSRNRKTGGSGLGLAIAKEIIENHKGTITVQSFTGINTFTCKLPTKNMRS